MKMRFKEWFFLLGLTGAGMMLANFIGFNAAFADSLPGVLILLGISLVAVVLDRVLPLKIPIIAYCSLLGLILALPFSPISELVVSSVAKINFTAPLTMVGSYAGMSISAHLKTFAKQGWKMIIVAVLVMSGTFLGSLVLSEFLLRLTGVI